MKLRKAAKNAPLNLDDPLETESDSSEHEYLSDVVEEDEDIKEDDVGEQQDDGTDDDGHDVEGESDDNSEVDASASEGGGDSAAVGQALDDTAECDGELTSNEEDDVFTQHHQHADKRGAFNPFMLLAEYGSDSDNDASPPGAARRTGELHDDSDVAVVTGLASGGVDDGEADAAVSGTSQPERSSHRRRRKPRRNPRRRRRQGAECAAAASTADADAGAAEAEVLCGGPPGAAGELVLFSHAAQRDGGLPGSVPAMEVPRPESEAAQIDLTGRGDVGCSPQQLTGDSDAGGEAGTGSDEREEGVADCWLCYGEGKVLGTGASSRDGSRGSLSGGHEAVGGGAGDNAETELVAPCRVCAGGLRYIHTRCFSRWLESSWALACPNCRTMYDSAVLDAFSSGPSVRSMLLSSCPPDHDLRQPFPHRTRTHFCVGGLVELSLECGGLTAVELLRRIRLMVDDMAAHGGDGGLGLVGDHGRILQLPSFEVTGLVLDFRAPLQDDPWGNWPVPGLMTSEDSFDDDDDVFWQPQRAESAADAGRHGWRDPTAGYADSDADDYDDDDDEDLPPLVPSRRAGLPLQPLLATRSRSQLQQVPPAAQRERSFTSGSMRNLWGQTVGDADSLMRPATSSEYVSAEVRLLDRQAAHLRRNLLELWLPAETNLPLGLPGGRGHGPTREASMRSAADRAALRAGQQRRRADLQLQQRSQQRHSGGSQGHQGMPGGARSGGARRR